MSSQTTRTTQSPFHFGERIVQQRVNGADSPIPGQKNIKPYMTSQHRDFFNKLPMLFFATQDQLQRPWASVIVGQPGFINTPTDQEMVISEPPIAAEHIFGEIQKNAAVGLLGLDFTNRRRNRMNGRIDSLNIDKTEGAHGAKIHIKVDQAFGNCPKYIQTRELISNSQSGRQNNNYHSIVSGKSFSQQMQQLISQSDTFFIASQYLTKQDAAELGTDMSHRGGNPGFVRLLDDRTIEWPDFVGNNYFNTLGNIEMDPRTSLLFLDYETGDLLTLTGKAQIIWDNSEINAFEGAERLVRFELDEAIYIANACPITWQLNSRSPFLEKTGTWTKAH